MKRQPLSRRLLKILLITLLLISYPLYRTLRQEAGPPFQERWFFAIFSPIVRGVNATGLGVSSLFSRYFVLVGTERENEGLRSQVGEFRQKEMFFHSLEVENERLTSLLGLQKRVQRPVLAARVTGYPPLSEFRVLLVDRGSQSRIQRGAIVLSPDGLVGRVIRVGPQWSQILLISDPTSAVDARDSRTGARGLVIGQGRKIGLARDLFIGALEFWDRNEEIREGDLLVTSGMDGVFDPDIPIGVVRNLRKDKLGVFQSGDLVPQADFQKLREVLISVKP